MKDLTLLYYTANRIGDEFAGRVRAALSAANREAPIVAVSQSGDPQYAFDEYMWPQMETFLAVMAQPSIYRVYQNILLGAKAARTPFVACCEDDTLYAPSHFTYRPALDTFAYDRSRWVITRRLSADGRRREAFYYWRERHQMAMCIAPRALLIEALEEKFAKYPEQPASTDVAKKSGWGEPGRYEKNLGLTPRKLEYFNAPDPSVTFNHSESLMGRRRVNPDDILCAELPIWGNADALWRRIHG